MTSSRLRTSVATYFDVCCEVNGSSLNRSSTVKVLYPPEFNDESTLTSIRQFCFPTGNEKNDGDAVQLFTFVLTDAQSQYTFGYCRLMPITNNCICILSGLSYTTHFYNFLNHISNVINNGTKDDLESLLTNAYHVDIPEAGGKLVLSDCTKIGRFVDIIADSNKLPTLRNDKFMLEFYNAVSEKQMIPLFASILKERRIIFTGRKLSQLSSCVFASSRLLYPFFWQNLFIPILPIDMMDMLMAPMPYLIGVPKKNFLRLNRADLDETVIVDLEEKTFESPIVDTIPPDAHSYLRSQLKLSSEMFLSDGLARSFLQTNVIIFGEYAKGFSQKEGIFSWDKKLFIERQRPAIQSFLNSIISKDGVQYFERFIEDRLTAFNNKTFIYGEFERELNSKKLRHYIYKSNQTVKDNANDVIVALKDRVQSISIKDKFGRFTQKDIKRQKLRSSKPLKTKKKLDPLSVDALDYDLDNCKNDEILTGKNNLNKKEVVSDAESVNSTEDLINFSDEEGIINNLYRFTKIESSSLANEKELSQPDNRLNEFISEFLPNDLTIQKLPQPNDSVPLIDNHSSFLLTNRQTIVSQQPHCQLFNENSNSSIQRKNNWETFE